MKGRPPVLIVVVAILYMAYLIWNLITDFSVTVACRFVLSGILFFFVLRGSRIAGNTLAVLCAISAAMAIIFAIAVIAKNLYGAILACGIAIPLLAFAWYLFSNPDVRRFQGKSVEVEAR